MPRTRRVRQGLFTALSLACLMALATPTSTLAQDADGDGIIDSLDPDDDNDGILDVDEGTTTEPGPDTPPDTDDDGIVDTLDPDDNNNAVTDADEPAPAQSGGGGGGGGGSSGGSGGSGNSGSSGGDSSSSPDSTTYLVSSLPVTGSGLQNSASPALLALIVALACLALAVASLDHRSHNRNLEQCPRHRSACRGKGFGGTEIQ